MGNRRGMRRQLGSLRQVFSAGCLVFLVGLGQSIDGGVLVPVQWLLFESESSPVSEESSDTEPAAPLSSLHRRPALRIVPQPVQRLAAGPGRKHNPTLIGVSHDLCAHAPNLPRGATIPIRC